MLNENVKKRKDRIRESFDINFDIKDGVSLEFIIRRPFTLFNLINNI